MDLSKIEKTIDGSSYAFSRLDCIGKQIDIIGVLEQFPHLKEINLSKNFIEDVSPIATIPYVLQLNLSNNKVESVQAWKEGVLKHLLRLDLSVNVLSTLEPLPFPALRKINLSRNKISSCEAFEGHTNITDLDLSYNALQSCEGIRNMPKLQKLILSWNRLSSVQGFSALPALQNLDLTGNELKDLSADWNETSNLGTIDLSGNQLQTPEVLWELHTLQYLETLKISRELDMGEEQDPKKNPAADADNLRLEAIICLQSLKNMDGQAITEKDQDDAKEHFTSNNEGFSWDDDAAKRYLMFLQRQKEEEERKLREAQGEQDEDQ